MRRLQWMTLWDQLRNRLETGGTSWGRNQILAEMDKLEREMVRKAEEEDEEQHREGAEGPNYLRPD